MYVTLKIVSGYMKPGTACVPNVMTSELVVVYKNPACAEARAFRRRTQIFDVLMLTTSCSHCEPPAEAEFISNGSCDFENSFLVYFCFVLLLCSYR